MKTQVSHFKKNDLLLKGFYALSFISFLLLMSIVVGFFCQLVIQGSTMKGFESLGSSLLPLSFSVSAAAFMAGLFVFIRLSQRASLFWRLLVKAVLVGVSTPLIVFSFGFAFWFSKNNSVFTTIIICTAVFSWGRLLKNWDSIVERVPQEDIEGARAIGMNHREVFWYFFIQERGSNILVSLLRVYLEALLLILPLVFLVPKGENSFSLKLFTSFLKFPRELNIFLAPMGLLLSLFALVTFFESRLRRKNV